MTHRARRHLQNTLADMESQKTISKGQAARNAASARWGNNIKVLASSRKRATTQPLIGDAAAAAILQNMGKMKEANKRPKISVFETVDDTTGMRKIVYWTRS